ncbi:MAG: co-chaperone GroES [Candidatus Nitrosotenuis sp.]
MAKSVSINPLPGYVLVKPIAAESRTETGLELPDTAKEKPQMGKVVKKGSSYLTDKGVYIDIPVKEDDVISYKKYTGQELKFGLEKYEIVHFADILAVVIEKEVKKEVKFDA